MGKQPTDHQEAQVSRGVQTVAMANKKMSIQVGQPKHHQGVLYSVLTLRTHQNNGVTESF